MSLVSRFLLFIKSEVSLLCHFFKWQQQKLATKKHPGTLGDVTMKMAVHFEEQYAISVWNGMYERKCILEIVQMWINGMYGFVFLQGTV